MDLAIIFVMGILLSDVMKMHGTWNPLNDIGDIIGWVIACVFLLAFVRLPIYFIVYGWPHGAFNASEWMQLMSGVLAIGFWHVMFYWRVPGRIKFFARKRYSMWRAKR